MNRWQQIRNIPGRFVGGRKFLLAFFVVFALLGCDSPADGQAGVISTGNTARVIGKVAARSGGLVRTLKLVTRQGRDVRVVDSTRSDSVGRFQFTETSSGTYWVEAWQGSHLIGASSEFVSDGKDVEILVAIIDPIYLRLDLRELGRVDSVFVDFPENPGRMDDSLWSVSLLRDSGSILHARIDQGGAPKWTEWLIQVTDGRATFIGLSNVKALPFLRQFDTSVFSVDRHTVALWTFDDFRQDGAIADLGPGGYHLSCPKGAILDSSLHGRALHVSSLVGNVPLRTLDSAFGLTIQGGGRGQWTMQARIRLDSLPRDGFQIAGFAGDPILTVSQGRALAVYQRMKSTRTGEWFSNLMITRSGIVPVGRWIDIALSVDHARSEVYVWIDGQAQDLIAMGDESTGTLYRDPEMPFVVGGLPTDGRRGPVLIDEIRLSDTLVYGRGFPHQASLSWVVGDPYEVQATSLLDSAGITTARPSEEYPLVGRGSKGQKLGRYLWKPEIPSVLEGREVLFAMLYFFDAAPPVPTARSFAIHEILQAWSPTDPRLVGWLGSDVFDDIRVARDPRSLTPLLPSAGSGGMLFDVTDLVQKWMADPSSRNGVLLRGENETQNLGRQIFGTANSGQNYPIPPVGGEPALIVHYR
ncbi:MAG: hypothetical protein IPK50_09945 [Fibrobacterota bacterium]|nr:hypothetical protein [Fibrobacterota bacterium]QQS07199.1 MAG: hypothetical protein IPK50_09945 [Fibrobacterota bacterium]